MSTAFVIFACIAGVFSLIIGFWRDPAAPFTTAIKVFCILAPLLIIWLLSGGIGK